MQERPDPVKPESGQESVWDYPRPPRAELTDKSVRVEFNSIVLAASTRAVRVLETSHPPVYYIPRQDIRMEYLISTPRRTICEFKGTAYYWSVQVGERSVINAAWSYPEPEKLYTIIQNHIAFYPSRMDACYVNEERVEAQEGDFYGGWITSDIVGPFKGGTATRGW